MPAYPTPQTGGLTVVYPVHVAVSFKPGVLDAEGKNVQKSLGLTLISLIFTMILGAIVFVKKDDTGFNRDQIREIVIQTNYDTCVADVEELNSVIPDPAKWLDFVATCG